MYVPIDMYIRYITALGMVPVYHVLVKSALTTVPVGLTEGVVR